MHSRIMRKSILLSTTFFLILYNLSLLNSSLGYAAADNTGNDESIITYQKNREAFFVEQRNENLSFQEQVSSLQTKIKLLKQNISDKNAELNRLDSIIGEEKQSIRTFSRIQGMVSSLLFPLLSAYSITISFFTAGEGSKILLLFVCITVLNSFIYLFRRRSSFFKRYKILLIVAVILLVVSIALPVFADDKTDRERVIDTLQSVEKILSQSTHERYIAILEEKAYPQIEIPPLQSGDPLFEIIPTVKIDTPEYWFTLAALYTHEGRNGKALDVVKKIAKASRLSVTEEHRKIIVNSIKYLIQEQQTQIASEIIDSLDITAMDTQSLLDLGIFLKEKQMQTSASKTLRYAISRANTVKESIKLFQFFISQNEIDKSDEALKKALDFVRTIDDLLLLGDSAIAANRYEIIEKMMTKVDKITDDYREKMKIVDMFLKHDRKEEATILFSKILKEDMSRTRSNVKRLLFLIDAALSRDFLPQACAATEHLIMILGGLRQNQAKSFEIRLETKIKSAENIPNKDQILLPHFYGLINEEQGIYDNAEKVYIHSVIESLSIILDSHGYKFPESLNDFFLLGRVWAKENRGDLIRKLDPVYSIIEKQYINQQSTENKKQIERIQKELHKLQEINNELDLQASKKKEDVSKLRRKLLFQGISTVASTIFIILAIIGCIIISWQYCVNLSRRKSFGFATKFIESAGWLQAMSLIGIISGFVFVIVGQFFQFFQSIDENTEKVSLLPTHFENSPPKSEKNSLTESI
jgi:hypothetical protein